VDSSAGSLIGSSGAFLDLFYTPGALTPQGTPTSNEVQVPVTITGSDVRSTQPAGSDWISFQTEVPLTLTGLASAQLSVYGAFAKVTIQNGGGTVDN
jgi:hypothetical protein